MRMLMINFLALFVLIFNALSQDTTSVNNNFGDLTLVITGFENNDGSVRVALSDSKEDYKAEGKAYRTAIESIQKMSAQCKFTLLPFGTYAIKTYHDENGNGELDTNFLGIPSENYGFSNNAKGSFGPASWEDAQFIFDKDSMVVEINLDE